jgi:Fusaric acid resistance protein-like
MSTVGSSSAATPQPVIPWWRRVVDRERREGVHAVVLGIACLVSYEAAKHALGDVHSVAPSDATVGGMWAVIATIFVYRDTVNASRSAAISRVAATFVSLVLCLIYLAVFSFHPVGLAILIVVGTLVVTALGRPGDAITSNITTTVLLVIVGLEPHNAWEQPILRLADTVIGVIIGVAVASSVKLFLERRRGS